jgi:hypothetical protein
MGEHRLPRPIKSMASQNRRRAEPGPIVLDTGRQASFYGKEKFEIEIPGMWRQ